MRQWNRDDSIIKTLGLLSWQLQSFMKLEDRMKKKIIENLPVLLGFLIIAVLLIIPTGYEGAVIYQDRERATAEVLEVDNSNILQIGVVSSGDQDCVLEIKDGVFKGEIVTGYNMLTGSLENDNVYKVGDKVFVLVSHKDGEIGAVSMIDLYRVDVEIILVVIFAIFLILTAGKTGIRAILSFGITILMIWKVLVPMYLNGYNPILVGILITTFLTIVIISLVFGFNRLMVSATTGSLAGILVTLIMGMLFTDVFQISGVVMTNSESLLYSGYGSLNLTQIFIASIFIGASGAVMDLAVDITSAVNEVVEKKPDISAKEAIISGMNVGKAAMGTMTTTLLLAYSGGYVSMLMVFMAQGTPVDNILNYKYVASEILDTIVGSFGLVSVAPLTAICAGVLLTKKQAAVQLELLD